MGQVKQILTATTEGTQTGFQEEIENVSNPLELQVGLTHPVYDEDVYVHQRKRLRLSFFFC